MKFKLLLLVYFLNLSPIFPQQSIQEDSLRVDELNKLGYEMWLTDPEATLANGKKALQLAVKLNYRNGIAEAHRVSGIGQANLNHADSAINEYLESLRIFKEVKNLFGVAKVLNNIGNLYKNSDYDRALRYFDRARRLAEKLKIRDLEAGCYLNKAIIYHKQKKFLQALETVRKGGYLFRKIENPTGITLSLSNEGAILVGLGRFNEAKTALLEANKRAKEADLNYLIPKIGFSLTQVYITEDNYEKAREMIDEGRNYGQILKDDKVELDYLFLLYKLDEKQGNYKGALKHLREIYRRDSIEFKRLESNKIALNEAAQKHIQKQKENEILLERAEKNRIIFWATVIVLTLSILVIMLLIIANKKKTKTNRKLKELNEEISRQKENLDKINQNLEAIIDERTIDLKIKNLKLSEYSSHLSHEIRSPIATLKGLLLLEKEKLIDHDELINELNTCVNNLDDKILNINQMLHNPTYKGMHYEHKKDETKPVG